MNGIRQNEEHVCLDKLHEEEGNFLPNIGEKGRIHEERDAVSWRKAGYSCL